MDVEKDYVIHSRDGKLGAPGTTSRADAKRIIEAAHAANPERGLLIHFHGGLVSTANGLAIAHKLAQRYADAGAYPVFFVWESGPFQTIKNNLHDILNDEVFQELVKKVGEWALKQLGDSFSTRGSGTAQVDEHRLRADFDAWFAGAASAPPVPLDTPERRAGSAARASLPSQDDLAADIESQLDNDPRFQQVMAGLYVERRRGPETTTRSAGAPPASVRKLVDDRALDEMFPRPPGETRAAFSWFEIAKFVAKVVIAVVRRHWNKRDHGTYTTIVEEVLRAAYLDKVGEVLWRMMKKDTADAFADDTLCVGTAMFEDLAALAAQGKSFSMITLVGHSTGAVYINNLVNRAAQALPNTKFNVVLLAPASRMDDFALVLQKHNNSIANFRMFSMTDASEAKDHLLGIIYPRSLLYFISGVLEGEADVPIVGMNRFLVDETVFDAENFKAVADVRKWLAQKSSYCVWSIVSGGDGLSSASEHHGDFDDNTQTLDSISYLVRKGF